MKKSKFGKLDLFDLFKGLIMAVLTTVLTVIMQMLTNVPPSINWKQVGIVATISSLGYILKQLGTNNNGDLLEKDR